MKPAPTIGEISSVYVFAGLILAAFWIFPASAQAGEITWAQAVGEAVEHHPDLVSADESVIVAKSNKGLAAAGLWPTITAEASGGASETRSAGSVSKNAFAYGISGRQLLFDGFKTVYEVEAAADAVDNAEYARRVTSSDVRLRLRKAYTGLWRAQRLVDITSRIADRRKQSFDLIQLRYDAGREHRGSLLTADANWAQAKFELDRAIRGLRTSQRSLIKELGRQSFEPLTVAQNIDTPAPPAEEPDFEQLAIQTPFLLQLAVQKEAAKWGVRSAVADFFPSIYASAATGRSGDRWLPQTTGWSAGASGSMTLFDGGSLWGGFQKARAQRTAAEADERSGKDGVLLTLESAWAAWQNAAGAAAVQLKYLDAARERAEIAQAEYGTALISFNDWIIIEDNLVQAEKSYLDAQAAVLNAESDWRQAKGDMLDETSI